MSGSGKRHCDGFRICYFYKTKATSVYKVLNPYLGQVSEACFLSGSKPLYIFAHKFS